MYRRWLFSMGSCGRVMMCVTHLSPQTPPAADRKPPQSLSTALCLSPEDRQREFSAAAISDPEHAAHRAGQSPFPLAQALSLQRTRMVLQNPNHVPSPRHTPGIRPTILLARARGVPLWRWCLPQLLRAIDCRGAVGGHRRAADAVPIQRLRPGGQGSRGD